MSYTVLRVPRITGFPIIIAGLIPIRSVVMAIPLTHHSAPPESRNRISLPPILVAGSVIFRVSAF